MDGAGYVKSLCRIQQSPLSIDPSVPRGIKGHLEDEADGLLFVDFGALYGVVACSPEEVS
jgi:hypothetical protein